MHKTEVLADHRKVSVWHQL